MTTTTLLPDWVWLLGSAIAVVYLVWERSSPRSLLNRRHSGGGAGRQAKERPQRPRRSTVATTSITNPRLTIELVPSTCWYSNVRSEVTPEEWDAIRKPVYRAAKYRCEICGGKGSKHPVECHEVWHYDDLGKVQTLVRMLALCPACHGVKHLGRSTAVGKGESAFRHLMRVNGWDEAAAGRYVETAMAEWKERSRWTWTLDLSALATYGVTPPVQTARSTGTSPGTPLYTVDQIAERVIDDLVNGGPGFPAITESSPAFDNAALLKGISAAMMRCEPDVDLNALVMAMPRADVAAAVLDRVVASPELVPVEGGSWTTARQLRADAAAGRIIGTIPEGSYLDAIIRGR